MFGRSADDGLLPGDPSTNFDVGGAEVVEQFFQLLDGGLREQGDAECRQRRQFDHLLGHHT